MAELQAALEAAEHDVAEVGGLAGGARLARRAEGAGERHAVVVGRPGSWSLLRNTVVLPHSLKAEAMAQEAMEMAEGARDELAAVQGEKERLEAEAAELRAEVGAGRSGRRRTEGWGWEAGAAWRGFRGHPLSCVCAAPVPHLPQAEEAQGSVRWREEREAKKEAEWDARLKEAYK